MTNISRELSEIYNLKNVAEHHKQFCAVESCGVSLLQLRWTAQRLALLLVAGPEQDEAAKVVESMPII